MYLILDYSENETLEFINYDTPPPYNSFSRVRTAILAYKCRGKQLFRPY